MSTIDSLPHTPDSGQDLPPTLKQRIHCAASDPAALTALLFELCPGLTPATALEWLGTDLAFEAEAVGQAAELLNETWEN